MGEVEISRRIFDLEQRLLQFASAVIDLWEKLPPLRAGNHMAGHLLRGGTSPYPNHGKAEFAESRQHSLHKLKVCLKEARHTRRWAHPIERKRWAKDDPRLLFVLNESDELIRTFFSSIQTAQKNGLAPSAGSPRRPHATLPALPADRSNCNVRYCTSDVPCSMSDADPPQNLGRIH